MRRRIAVLGLTFALLAAACGGDDGGSGDAGGEGSDGASTEASEPTAGGELVVGTIFDPFGLEPTTFVGGVTDAHIALALYDPLMMLTPEGDLEPWLAESLETADDQTYTIRLRDGVTFHDGTPLDAEAVKVNLERHMNPETQSRALANAINIASVTAVDGLTVEVALRFPWPAFPEVLAGNLGLIASPQAIAAGTLNDTPVGSGPFRFEERVPGDHTIVVRNESYWREGRPHVDRITFRVMLDDDVRQTSVANGEIHAAQSIRADTLAEADGEDGVHATITPGRVNTIHINTSAEPVDDVRVRQALAYALDYEALNEVIYGGAGQPVHTFISEDSPFYDENVSYPEYDPERAAELVEEYEAENGPVAFTFRCYSEPSRVQLTELASEMWRAAGIDVTTELSDQTTLVLDLLEANYTVACFSMGAETTDPDLMWYGSLHSESRTNYSKYANGEMDVALDTGRSSTDEATRVEAYGTVQELLASESPIIQYAASPWGWVVADDVGGLVALPGGEFVSSEVFVDG